MITAESKPIAELVEMLDTNFRDNEHRRLMLLNAPKYGNDHPEADVERALPLGVGETVGGGGPVRAVAPGPAADDAIAGD